MSLRLFVYYCALAGAWAGFIGWVLGSLLSPASGDTHFSKIVRSTLLGMFLGLVVAFGLSFLDAAFNVSLRQLGKVFTRVFAAVLVGIFGGFVGGCIGESLNQAFQAYDIFASAAGVLSPFFFIFGWTIVGFLIGASICFFELAASLASRKNVAGAFKKFIKCVIGGTVGGVLGGVIAYILNVLAAKIFSGRDTEKLWSPTAIGFVALGACIGLLVGLAQILLKEAWIRVEAGFRPGREMILTKEKTSVGRAENSDIAFFGDNAVEKIHAYIVLDAGRYYLEDQQTPGGSFVNEVKVEGRAPLKAGDLIRVGIKSAFRFNERAKRKD